MRNYGQHNALMCGFHNARGEFIVTLDDDLQNPPEEVPKLLEGLRSGDFDLVYGRYVSKKHSVRCWSTRFTGPSSAARSKSPPSVRSDDSS